MNIIIQLYVKNFGPINLLTHDWRNKIMIEVINIEDLVGQIKPIVNRGPHTTEDEVFEAFRSLGVGDFKNANLYFGGFDGNFFERPVHPPERPAVKK